ncbi:unnamed protein product [Prorocentrum cordatum]|uniref:Kinesin light chain n=1 Tax=Prorocentrum cordatum TaxID=2364126 RepID=A0ABN9SKE7_9DINO|nr:unnamed protein product [Polarella glacialis]
MLDVRDRVADFGDDEPEWRRAARRAQERRRGSVCPPPLQLLVAETVAFDEGLPRSLFYSDRGGYIRATRRGFRDETGELLEALVSLARERRRAEQGAYRRAERAQAAAAESDERAREAEAAVRSAEAEHGDHPCVATALRALAGAKGRRRLFHEQAQLLERAVGIWQRLLDEGIADLGPVGEAPPDGCSGQLSRRKRPSALQAAHPSSSELAQDLFQALVELSEARAELGQQEQRVFALERALGVSRGAHAHCSDLEVARVSVRLAAAIEARGWHEAGEQLRLLSEALPVLERELGEESVELAEALAALAAARGAVGEPEKQVELLQRVLRIREQVNGKEHPDLVELLVSLGMCLGKQDSFRLQSQHYGRALRIRRRADAEADRAIAGGAAPGDGSCPASPAPTSARRCRGPSAESPGPAAGTSARVSGPLVPPPLPSPRPRNPALAPSPLARRDTAKGTMAVQKVSSTRKMGVWRLALRAGPEKRLSDQCVVDKFIKYASGSKNCWPGGADFLQMQFWKVGNTEAGQPGPLVYRYDSLRARAEPDGEALQRNVRNHFERFQFLGDEADRALVSAVPGLISQHLSWIAGLQVVSGEFEFARDCHGRLWLADVRELFVAASAAAQQEGLTGGGGTAGVGNSRKIYRYLSQEALQHMQQGIRDESVQQKIGHMTCLMTQHYTKLKHENGLNEVVGRAEDEVRELVIPVFEGTDRRALARAFGAAPASHPPASPRTRAGSAAGPRPGRAERACSARATLRRSGGGGGRLFAAGAAPVVAAPRPASGARAVARGQPATVKAPAAAPAAASAHSQGDSSRAPASASGGAPDGAAPPMVHGVALPEAWRGRTELLAPTPRRASAGRQRLSAAGAAAAARPGSPPQAAAPEPTIHLAESSLVQALLACSGSGAAPQSQTLDRIGPARLRRAGDGIRERTRTGHAAGYREVKVPDSGGFKAGLSATVGTDIAIAAAAYA